MAKRCILRNFRLSPGMVLRMFADIALLNLALFLALAVRFWIVVVFQNSDGAVNSSDLFQRYLHWYLLTSIPLTSICLIAFFFSGFYTYSQSYQSHYKILVISRAVTLSFLIFGFSGFFFWGEIPLPRGGIVIAWLLSLGLLVAARVWNQLWDRYVRPEHEIRQQEIHGRKRHILVVGGAGYIGSALLPKLLKKGYHVRLLDVLLFGNDPIRNVIDHPNLEIIKGNFCHVENVAPALRGVDSVVHLGAIVGDPACDLDEDLTIDVNLYATRMIAELALEIGVKKFVFASTCSVYGWCDEVLDERSEARPARLYGRTKLASERVLLSMARHGLAPSILRFSTIYGLSGRTRFDLVVNRLTAQAKIDGEFTQHGGSQWRPFVHVDDAAAAIVKVLEAPSSVVAEQIFNVGSNQQNYRIEQIAELIQEQVIGSRVIVSENDQDDRNYRVDFSKIANLIDFQPQWTVEAGIRQVLEAIASGEISDYRDVRYSNVEFLNREGTNNLARDNWARQLIEELDEN